MENKEDYAISVTISNTENCPEISSGILPCVSDESLSEEVTPLEKLHGANSVSDDLTCYELILSESHVNSGRSDTDCSNDALIEPINHSSKEKPDCSLDQQSIKGGNGTFIDKTLNSDNQICVHEERHIDSSKIKEPIADNCKMHVPISDMVKSSVDQAPESLTNNFTCDKNDDKNH